MRIEEFVQVQQVVAEDQALYIHLPTTSLKTQMKNVTVLGLGKDHSGLLQIVDFDGHFWYFGVTEIQSILVQI